MTNIKKILILTSIVLLRFSGIFGTISVRRNIFITLPLSVEMVLMLPIQWLSLIIPIVFMKLFNMKLSDIGFTKKKIANQIVIGVILGLAMSLVFTVLPILAGFKDEVGTYSYTQTWQYVYLFVYMIFGVALQEEFFYRGFLFERILNISQSKWATIIISSCIFGLGHIFNGEIIQVFVAALVGVIFCICRDKIKNCTTLSLIIMHGIDNALIPLFVAILP